MFFENIYKICTEAPVMETILNKILVPQNGISHRHLSISFLRHVLWLLHKIEQNTLPWMITMFGAKTPESSNICQTVVAFSYLVSLCTFSFFLCAYSRIFEKYCSQKNPYNWKCFFVKISLLKNFINVIRDVTCYEVLITLVNLCDETASFSQGCNGPVKNTGSLLSPQND